MRLHNVRREKSWLANDPLGITQHWVWCMMHFLSGISCTVYAVSMDLVSDDGFWDEVKGLGSAPTGGHLTEMTDESILGFAFHLLSYSSQWDFLPFICQMSTGRMCCYFLKKYLDQLRIKSPFFYGVAWNSLSSITAYDVSILYCDVGICIVFFYLNGDSRCVFT